MIEDHPDFQKAVRSLHEKIVEQIAPRVLVIDDEESDVIVLKHALMEEFPHIQVVWRSDPTTALSTLQGFKFDLVFLDLRLGLGLTGVDVFKSLRACSTVPVAGLTGLDDKSALVQQALAAGLEVIFRKPISGASIRLLFGKCI